MRTDISAWQAEMLDAVETQPDGLLTHHDRLALRFLILKCFPDSWQVRLSFLATLSLNDVLQSFQKGKLNFEWLTEFRLALLAVQGSFLDTHVDVNRLTEVHQKSTSQFEDNIAILNSDDDVRSDYRLGIIPFAVVSAIEELWICYGEQTQWWKKRFRSRQNELEFDPDMYDIYQWRSLIFAEIPSLGTDPEKDEQSATQRRRFWKRWLTFDVPEACATDGNKLHEKLRLCIGSAVAAIECDIDER